MRLKYSCIFLLGFFSGWVKGQELIDQKIDIDLETRNFEYALITISRIANVKFAYGIESLPKNKSVSLHFKQIRLKHLLIYLLEDTKLDYKLMGEQIVFFKKNEPLPSKVTINGYVIDSLSGEKLIGVNVYMEGTNIGTNTNLYGFYSLTVYPGEWKFKVSYLGYKSRSLRMKLEQNINENIIMAQSNTLQEVEIVDQAYNSRQVGINAAWDNFVAKDFSKIPAVLGEQDIIKLTQSIAGIQSGTDGLGGLHIRGGDPGHNLILMDGVPVYNPFHTAGFFSVFNPSAVQTLGVYKGGIPARYFNTGAGVLDVRTREGNNQNFKAEAGLSLLAANILMEGPIKKGKSSFLVSARRTTVDPWIKSVSTYLNQRENKTGQTTYSFYDINAKANFQLNDNNKVFVSLYQGNDLFKDQSQEELFLNPLQLVRNRDNLLNWGNTIGTLRWNKQVSNKIFSNTTINYSRFRYNSVEFQEDIEGANRIYDLNIFRSEIRDVGFRTDLDFIPTPTNKIKSGFGITFHRFEPLAFAIDENSPDVNVFVQDGQVRNLDTLIRGENVSSVEANAYFEDEVSISDNILANLGVSTVFYSVKGINYLNILPRLSVSFVLSKNLSLFVAYDEMQQNQHLLSDVGSNLPNDFWIPATSRILPANINQTSIGVHARLPKAIDFKIEAYIKKMENILSFEDGARFTNSGILPIGGTIDSRNWEDKVSPGRGQCTGVEVTLQRRVGRLGGWVNYTYSIATRQFQEVNFNRVFPYRYDRRHLANIVGNYKFNDGFEFLANFTFGTGQPFSVATEKTLSYLPGQNMPIEVINWSGTNAFRLENFHRLDIGFNFTNKKKWGEEQIYFGLINVYNRRNTLYIQLKSDPDNPELKSLVSSSLLPILPAISYKAKF